MNFYWSEKQIEIYLWRVVREVEGASLEILRSLGVFVPLKFLIYRGFRNFKIEYFFLFSPVVLSKSFLNEKTTV